MTRAFDASGAGQAAAQSGLNVGDLAPAFELDNQDGQLVRSADLLAHGTLLITFFRGH